MATVLLLSVVAAACTGPVGGRAASDEPRARQRLLGELAAVGAAVGGTLGVSAVHLEVGRPVALNGAARFPMASTFKVAVALALLDRVDHRTIALDQRIAVDGDDLSPGSGEILKEVMSGQRRPMAIAELLAAMMRESDNTATDLLLARVGGPAAVTGHVRALGVADLDVSRPAAQLVADSWGFTLPPPGGRTRAALSRLHGRVPEDARRRAAAAFLQDPRDTTTPDAMVALLERLHRGTALSRASTALLVEHMEKCETGARRLKGGLPPGTAVAHKTGTLTNVATNDVGIVTLPWRGGHVALAVYLKGSPRPLVEQERAIAQAARHVYDYYAR